jgi:two-component system OmpR family sensor kinase
VTRRLSLRDRLAVAYTLALVLGCAAFAAVALLVARATAADSLDARLRVAAYSAAAIVDVGAKGRVALDALDKHQIGDVLGGQLSVVLTDGTNVVYHAGSDVPAAVRDVALATRRTQLVPLHVGRDDVHAAIVEIARNGRFYGTAVVWRSLEEYDEFEKRLALVFLALTAAIALVAFAIGREVARRGLAPLREIAHVASEIEATDLGKRLGAGTSDDELGRLRRTFDRMLDRLQAAFERQRRFTADASHELRAPLSVLRAEADLALRRERSPAEYREALVSIADEADRLDALIDGLLSAARAEEGTVATARFDLVPVARDAARHMEPLARAKCVAIATEPVTSDACIVADEALVARALLAIVHNAVKYAPENGSVGVRVARSATDVVVEVTDDGPGFSAAGLTSALDRFWRDDAARGRSGMGLGLAIARAVVERCGGTLSLANRDAGGALVRARFPLAR